MSWRLAAFAAALAFTTACAKYAGESRASWLDAMRARGCAPWGETDGTSALVPSRVAWRCRDGREVVE